MRPDLLLLWVLVFFGQALADEGLPPSHGIVKLSVGAYQSAVTRTGDAALEYVSGAAPNFVIPPQTFDPPPACRDMAKADYSKCPGLPQAWPKWISDPNSQPEFSEWTKPMATSFKFTNVHFAQDGLKFGGARVIPGSCNFQACKVKIPVQALKIVADITLTAPGSNKVLYSVHGTSVDLKETKGGPVPFVMGTLRLNPRGTPLVEIDPNSARAAIPPGSLSIHLENTKLNSETTRNVYQMLLPHGKAANVPQMKKEILAFYERNHTLREDQLKTLGIAENEAMEQRFGPAVSEDAQGQEEERFFEFGETAANAIAKVPKVAKTLSEVASTQLLPQLIEKIVNPQIAAQLAKGLHENAPVGRPEDPIDEHASLPSLQKQQADVAALASTLNSRQPLDLGQLHEGVAGVLGSVDHSLYLFAQIADKQFQAPQLKPVYSSLIQLDWAIYNRIQTTDRRTPAYRSLVQELQSVRIAENQVQDAEAQGINDSGPHQNLGIGATWVSQADPSHLMVGFGVTVNCGADAVAPENWSARGPFVLGAESPVELAVGTNLVVNYLNDMSKSNFFDICLSADADSPSGCSTHLFTDGERPAFDVENGQPYVHIPKLNYHGFSGSKFFGDIDGSAGGKIPIRVGVAAPDANGKQRLYFEIDHLDDMQILQNNTTLKSAVLSFFARIAQAFGMGIIKSAKNDILGLVKDRLDATLPGELTSLMTIRHVGFNPNSVILSGDLVPPAPPAEEPPARPAQHHRRKRAMASNS